MEGDFGVPRQSKLYEYVKINMFRSDGYRSGGEESDLTLTYEESELRDAAYHFSISLPQSMSRKNRQSGTSSYADNLKYSGYQHGSAQIGEIQGQIEADFSAFQRFAILAKLVIQSDQIRELELIDNSAAFTEYDRNMAISRIKENQTVIEATFLDLTERFADYDYAIARSRLDQPLTLVENAESLLDLFREKVVFTQSELRRLVEGAVSSAAYKTSYSSPSRSNTGERRNSHVDERPISLKP